jgi:hypothetical protein
VERQRLGLPLRALVNHPVVALSCLAARGQLEPPAEVEVVVVRLATIRQGGRDLDPSMARPVIP